LRPVRTAAWEEVDQRVIIDRPKPKWRGLTAPLERLGFWMSSRRIRLDPKGSFIWKLLDGGHSVQAIADGMRAEFGPEVEPAEERVGLLIRQLRTQEMLAYPGWDEDAVGGVPPEVAPRG
jgi:hypothetical protein